MADACENDQKVSGYNPVNIAIVDDGGDLILFRRQNNAFLKHRYCTKEMQSHGRKIEEIVYGKKDGNTPELHLVKDIVAFAGGLPIKTKDGHLLIGVLCSCCN